MSEWTAEPAARCPLDKWHEVGRAPVVAVPWGEKPRQHRQAPKPRPLPPAVETPRVVRPGDLLARIIHKITGIAPCAPCDARRRQMNQWGWWGCWKRRGEISGWIVVEAAKHGRTVESGTALGLLKAAWREVRPSFSRLAK